MQVHKLFTVWAAVLLIRFDVSESVQNLYHFVNERCDVSEVDDTIVKNFSYKCVKVSRNELYLNMTFISNVNIVKDEDAQLLISTSLLSGNQYRKGPILFKIPICSGLKHTDFDIPHMFQYSNVRSCPIRKGNFYYIYKLEPNGTNFPPLIPEGSWKIENRLLIHTTVGFCVTWYTKIVYPLPTF